MKKIIIIGAGFAGLTALQRLCGWDPKLDITLLDKKKTFDFLPLLPDCIGRDINPEFLTYEIKDLAKKFGFKFIEEQVAQIDLEKKQITTKSQTLSYDYLIIASGSETNFYGNEAMKRYAYALDGTADALKINHALRENSFDNFIIGGGGYTGIEVATNLRVYLNKIQKSSRIIIVEYAPAILGPLPEWMRNYVAVNLKRLKIEVFLNATITKIEGGSVYISAGEIFPNAMLIWAAGVKTAVFIQNLNLEQSPQGRIKVDNYLRLNESCFIAGDAAYFPYRNGFLRMAVQFAIMQGDSAAMNIINSIEGKGLYKYRPVDLGYIIPMANNKSCGKVFGLNLRGYLPTVLHFIMCIYRSYGLRNKLGIIKSLLKTLAFSSP